MIRLYLSLTLAFVFCSLPAQQWVEEQYDFELTADIPYGVATDFNGEPESLFLDLYLPQLGSDSTQFGRLPLMIMIHGGAFRLGDKADPQFTPVCESFARRGYVTASIGYRLGFINDDQFHNCNLVEEFACNFGADNAEIPRAYYRAVQDVNLAIRFLTDCHEDYGINRNNVFIAGESAGGFIALGAGLTDLESERPLYSFAQPGVPAPHVPSTADCPHNVGKVFNDSIERPDLGPLHPPNPVTPDYNIRGLGNMFGATYGNLLAGRDTTKIQPAIYTFHQPCDLLVPVDSGKVFDGLSWCYSSCLGCTPIYNTDPIVYGSRGLEYQNASNNYGYLIQAEYAGPEDPKTCLPFVPGGCLDQLENNCHSYDNRAARLNNMAVFFADLIDPEIIICNPNSLEPVPEYSEINVYPNPFSESLYLRADRPIRSLKLYDRRGNALLESDTSQSGAPTHRLNTGNLPAGVYFLRVTVNDGRLITRKLIKK